MNLSMFTVEEESLMCIFDISSRTTLISEIGDTLPHFDEPELCEIAHNTLRKLQAISDLEFAALSISPEYFNDEED